MFVFAWHHESLSTVLAVLIVKPALLLASATLSVSYCNSASFHVCSQHHVICYAYLILLMLWPSSRQPFSATVITVHHGSGDTVNTRPVPVAQWASTTVNRPWCLLAWLAEDSCQAGFKARHGREFFSTIRLVGMLLLLILLLFLRPTSTKPQAEILKLNNVNGCNDISFGGHSILEGGRIPPLKSHGQALEEELCFPGVLSDNCSTNLFYCVQFSPPTK